MIKLTKLSVIALFSVFLTACDKPVENASVSTANTNNQSANQPQKLEEKVEEKVLVDTAEQDYKAFREWQKAQEKTIEEAINSEVEKLGNKVKDEKLLGEVRDKALLAQIEVIKENAANLTITDPKVQLLKDKSLEALSLGAQLMVQGEKVTKAPTEAGYKAFSDLQVQLDKVVQEGRAIEMELSHKYDAVPEKLPEPAAETAPIKEEQNAQPQEIK